MNETTLPNWLFAIILLFSLWGLLIVIGACIIFALAWHDNYKLLRKKRKEDDEEYRQMYQSMIAHIESGAVQ